MSRTCRALSDQFRSLFVMHASRVHKMQQNAFTACARRELTMDCASALDRPARVVGTKNNACCRVATSRRACAIALALCALCALVACTSNSAIPTHPGPLATPKTIDDVTGIWRTVRQNTLELRKTGSYALISPVANAMGGSFVLDADHITFSDTKGCGSADGVYRIQVSPKNKILLTEPDDACAPRRLALTSDPLVYAQPDFS